MQHQYHHGLNKFVGVDKPPTLAVSYLEARDFPAAAPIISRQLTPDHCSHSPNATTFGSTPVGWDGASLRRPRTNMSRNMIVSSWT